ncbi:MAG: CHAT domain-containing protein [Pirellulaceae bacterium]|nr:CHAT domain-containing protein [Pirellulaceae bacterium]
MALSLYQDGEFASALNAFRQAGGGGIRSTEGRWVDSICYHAMLGECHYQLGQPAAALENFNAALQLLVAHRDWLLRVQFPAGIDAQVRPAQPPINWGQPTRRTVVGRFPDKLISRQGSLNPDQPILPNGVVAPPELVPVYVGEVVRCAALAMRRRLEILGPCAPYEPLTQYLVAALARRPAPPNHWSQAWVGVLLGLAYVSDGKSVQGIAELRQSLVMLGQYDHALTGIALLELGKLAVRQGRLDVAETFFQEATFAAAAFEQWEVMEEAFRGASTVHRLRNPGQVLVALAPAAEWSRRNSRYLEASLLVALAEQFTSQRETAAAGRVLAQAQRLIARSEMNRSLLGARLQHQAALVAYQTGNAPAGDAAVASALALQQPASLRLFQIDLADKLFLAGGITPRIADQLYAEVLREPTADDWTYEPLETLAVLSTPHPLPLEHWFEVALARRDLDLALEVADRCRRHRFHVTLPLGGRLLALRWLLEAPDEALDEPARLRRRDLLVRYPAYAEVSRQARAARVELAALPADGGLAPPAGEDEAAARRQTELYAQLAQLSAAQELLLREMALQREPAPMLFPPLRSIRELRPVLPAGHRVLAFFATSRGLHAFTFAREDEGYEHWEIEDPGKLRADMAQLLRQWGLYEANTPIGLKELSDDRWRVTARSLMGQLASPGQASLWQGTEELILVPDSFLWYLPLAALPWGPDDQPLLARMRVRTVPTVSLALPDGRRQAPLAATAVVTGRLFPRADDTYASQVLDDLRGVLPGVFALPERLPAPSSLVAAGGSRLVVLQSHDDLDRGPYLWSPLPLDRGKPGSTLADWNGLPWGAPDQVILPGYTTAAENSLKQGGLGDEVFLSVCGLLASGSRTLLLSRWRVGGQSWRDLLREYAQELPHVSAAAAWQRSVLLGMQNELDAAREPRLKPFTAETSPRASHPFFWAGYLLVDTAGAPAAAQAAAP